MEWEQIYGYSSQEIGDSHNLYSYDHENGVTVFFGVAGEKINEDSSIMSNTALTVEIVGQEGILADLEYDCITGNWGPSNMSAYPQSNIVKRKLKNALAFKDILRELSRDFPRERANVNLAISSLNKQLGR